MNPPRFQMQSFGQFLIPLVSSISTSPLKGDSTSQNSAIYYSNLLNLVLRVPLNVRKFTDLNFTNVTWDRNGSGGTSTIRGTSDVLGMPFTFTASVVAGTITTSE